MDGGHQEVGGLRLTARPGFLVFQDVNKPHHKLLPPQTMPCRETAIQNEPLPLGCSWQVFCPSDGGSN